MLLSLFGPSVSAKATELILFKSSQTLYFKLKVMYMHKKSFWKFSKINPHLSQKSLLFEKLYYLYLKHQAMGPI